MARLAAASVDVFQLDLDGLTETEVDHSELGPDERDRLARFVHASDRLHYAAAHVALRRLLAARTGIPPASLAFARDSCPRCGGPHGRPVMAGGDAPHFSLSHTCGQVLVAMADDHIGIDVERVPTACIVDELLPELHPGEQVEVRSAPRADQPEIFSQLWTRKEAYLKGVGTGLIRGLARDYLGSEGRVPRPSGWTVLDLDEVTGYSAAVAVAASTAVVRCHSVAHGFLGFASGPGMGLASGNSA